MPLPLLGAAAMSPWLMGLLGMGAGTAGWKIGEQIAPWLFPQQEAAEPAGLTWQAQQALEKIGYPIPPETRFAEPTPMELGRAALEAAGVGLVEEEPPGVEIPPRPTQALPEGFKYRFDRDLNRWVPEFVGLTAQQRAQQAQTQQQFEFQQQQFAWQQEQARLATLERERPEPISPFEQQQFQLQQQQLTQQRAQQAQQFGLQEQQFGAQQQQFQQQLQFQQAQAQAAQEEQERRYGAQLAAQPINWLQYAAYTGQQPVIQPWMQPLGFQETEGALPPGYEVGQPIPGLQLSEGMFQNLPQLRTPSAQLQARWGPTAQAQFLGYRQARTGAAPEETQFRLGAQRAPTGAYGGFSRFR